MIENAISLLPKRRKYQKLRSISLLCLATLNVTACDYVTKKFYPDFKQNVEKTYVEKPAFAREAISIEKVRDIATTTPADNNIFTVNHVTTVNQKTTKEQLVGNKQLFTTVAKNDGERFQRIENKIQHIADTLSKMSPAITRLMDVDSELDALTFQLEELINKGQMNALVQGGNKDTMAKEVAVQPKTASSPFIQEAMNQTTSHTLKDISPAAGDPKQSTTSSNDLIHKIRLADHSNKTRIVFETEEKLDYSIKIDSVNKIMTIHFPEGQLPSSPASRARFSNLVQDIAQHKTSDGSSFSFKLSQAPKTSKDFRMSPDEDVSRQRVVIDLIH